MLSTLNYMLNYAFSFWEGEREVYLVWTSTNNSHSTFLQHFKTMLLIVKSISRRGEEEKPQVPSSLAFKWSTNGSKSSIRFHFPAFAC